MSKSEIRPSVEEVRRNFVVDDVVDEGDQVDGFDDEVVEDENGSGKAQGDRDREVIVSVCDSDSVRMGEEGFRVSKM